MGKLKYLLLTFVFTLTLLPSLCFAQEQDEQQVKAYLIRDFSKGQTSHISKYNLPENAATIAQNVRINEKYSSLAKRDPLRTYGTIGSSKVNSLYRYYLSNGTKHLVASGTTYLYAGDDDAGTFQIIKEGLTNGAKFTFVTYQDILIGFNGDRPIKWDGVTAVTANTTGHRTASNLAADLGAPFATLLTGTDLDASKWYQYRILTSDGTNTYYSTARSNAILTGADVHNIRLSDIPIGEEGTTERQIYRTEGAADKATVEADTAFKHVTTIYDNSTTTFDDDIADGSLGASLSITGALDITPPSGKYCHIHKEYLFVAGVSDGKSDLLWSDQFNPDWFLATDYEPIRPDDGDEITFLDTILGILVVGKTNSIMKFYTSSDSTGTWSSDGPYSKMGCHAPYTKAVTPKGIIYLNRYGLYIFNGQFSSLLSDVITDSIVDIKKSDIEDAVGIYWNNQYQMSYTSDDSGSSNNNRVLLYDFIRDSYIVDTKSVDSMATLESGSDLGNLYYGSSLTDGYVTKEGTKESVLTKQFKSDFDAGVYDDMASFGTEDTPQLELAWDITINGAATDPSYNLTIDGFQALFPDAIIDRPAKIGSWTSPAYKVSASLYNELKWHESLNSYGDVTWRVRSSATEGGLSGVSWSSNFSNPSGSDLSGLTANTYVQVQANLSTSDILFTPSVFTSDTYLFNISYSKDGAIYETAINSIWESGWLDFVPNFKTLIKRVRVYYRGETGTLNIRYQNLEGFIDSTEAIDLSVDPDDDIRDNYMGAGEYKAYTFAPGRDDNGNSAIGEMWKFQVYDNGIDVWSVDRIEVIYIVEELKI